MLSNTQNAIIINTGKDRKISKNRFNRYDGQVVKTTYRPPGMWGKLTSDRLDVGLP